MKSFSPSKKLLIEKIMQASQKTRVAIRGLTIRALTKSIRVQLGVSQKALAKRDGVPQSTISRIEQEEEEERLLQETTSKLWNENTSKKELAIPKTCFQVKELKAIRQGIFASLMKCK